MFGDRAFLKNDYVARATGTQVGIGANSRDEALYPILDKDADGQPLDGSKHVHAALRQGPAAAGERVLVDHDVRPAASSCW